MKDVGPVPDLPDEVVAERLKDFDELLRERLDAEKPMTTADAMEFARNAYLRGYFDRLLGRVQVPE